MRTSLHLPLVRAHIPGLLAWILSVVSLSLLAELPPDGQLRVRLHADPIHEEGVGHQILKVSYPGTVDVNSLDSHDLWVISHNGYNRLANFEEVVPLEGVAEEFPEMPVPHRYEATYSIPPPSGDFWRAEDNESYAVLLEPNQVTLETGGSLPFQHLGFLRVAVGEPPSDPLILTEAFVVREGDKVFLKLVLEFEFGRFEVVDWGEPRVEGDQISLHLEVEPASSDGSLLEDPARLTHLYDVTDLPPGGYLLTISLLDHFSGGHTVYIPAPPDPNEVPAEVMLAVLPDANGQPIAEVTIHFIDPYFVLANRGTAVLDGKRIVIEAEAEEVVFFRAPDEPAITELRYELPVEEPGVYELVFKLNGLRKAATEFHFPFEEPGLPVIHSFRAHPEVIELGDEVTLSWEVTGAEHLEIRPGIGPVDGNQITIIPEPVPQPMEGNGATLEGEPASSTDPNEPMPLLDLIPRNAIWKYSDTGETPPPHWTSPEFDDSGWKSGAAELGYGDGDETTVVDYGENADQKQITTYFRHRFDVPEEVPPMLFLWLKRDDGAVVYLNGEELLRSNMPDGEMGPETLASGAALEDGRADPEIFPVDAGLLSPGANLIAVEIHQVRPASSDISFALSLGGEDPIHVPASVTYTLIASNEKGSTRSTTTVVFGDSGGQPPAPREAWTKVFREGEEHFARVELALPHGVVVTGWGALERVENRFSATVQLSRESELPAGFPYLEPAKNYSLGYLEPGVYELELRSGETWSQRTGFVVVDHVHEPAIHAELQPEVDANGHVQLFVRLDFTEYGAPVQLTDWGEPHREGRHFYADVQVKETNTDLETPGAPPVFEHVYVLENLEPNHYAFQLAVNGSEVGHTTFLLPGDDPFMHWLEDWLAGSRTEEPSQETSNAGIQNLDDADGDGMSDLYEWALGLNPVDPNDRNGIKPMLVEHEGEQRLAIQFHRLRTYPGLMYRIETSHDLQHWQSAGSLVDSVETRQTTEDLEEVTLRFNSSTDESPHHFVRIRIERITLTPTSE